MIVEVANPRPCPLTSDTVRSRTSITTGLAYLNRVSLSIWVTRSVHCMPPILCEADPSGFSMPEGAPMEISTPPGFHVSRGAAPMEIPLSPGFRSLGGEPMEIRQRRDLFVDPLEIGDVSPNTFDVHTTRQVHGGYFFPSWVTCRVPEFSPCKILAQPTI
jgi:hypothetical protein